MGALDLMFFMIKISRFQLKTKGINVSPYTNGVVCLTLGLTCPGVIYKHHTIYTPC